jgi:hypothetical protein
MTEILDRPPPGWFVLDVMPTKDGSREYAALMMDVDPDDEDWKQWRRPSRDCFVRIPGVHDCRDDAWDALEAMMATLH